MKNPISKATTTSGRFILTISFLLISSQYLGFEINKLPLLGQSGLDSIIIKKLALPLLVFLSIGHIVNWIHDHSNYVIEANKDTITSIRVDLDRINNMIDEMSSSENYTTARGLSNVIGNFSPELNRIKHPIDRLGRFASFSEIFLIYIQHFIIPLGLCFWSLYLLIYCSS